MPHSIGQIHWEKVKRFSCFNRKQTKNIRKCFHFVLAASEVHTHTRSSCLWTYDERLSVIAVILINYTTFCMYIIWIPRHWNSWLPHCVCVCVCISLCSFTVSKRRLAWKAFSFRYCWLLCRLHWPCPWCVCMTKKMLAKEWTKRKKTVVHTKPFPSCINEAVLMYEAD